MSVYDEEEKIRFLREELGLTQTELAGDGLSRNNLSGIELGKTRLTEANALYLYRQLITCACIKSKFINIDFSELVQPSKEYKNYTAAYKVMKMLSSGLVDEEVIEGKVVDLNRYNIGILKYYTNINYARMIRQTDPIKAKLFYKNAIEFIKWFDLDTYEELQDIAIEEMMNC